jgi:hypothetical protein
MADHGYELSALSRELSQILTPRLEPESFMMLPIVFGEIRHFPPSEFLKKWK